MGDLIKKEKQLFASLKMNLLNDYIRIDKSYVPEPYSNKLNRFYFEDESFWFARLKIKDSKILYYFGFNKEDKSSIKPDLILKFNGESSISPIKFFKDKITILCKLKNNNEDYVKSLIKYFKISKKEDFYFFVVGDLQSNEVLNNIKLFVEKVEYDINFKDNYLLINDPIIDINNNHNNQGLNTIKNNVEVLYSINILKETPLSQKLIDKIINFLFVFDENKNYSLNYELFDFNIPIKFYFSFINIFLKHYEEYLDLDVDAAFRLFKNNFNEKISNLENILNQNISYSKDEIDDDALLNSYMQLFETPKIKYHLIPSYGVDEVGLSKISNNLKIDIDKGIITKSDDPYLIIEKYFMKYVSMVNSNKIFKYFEEYVNGDLFKELLEKYNGLTQSDVEDIKDKIKSDIEKENLNNTDIDKRFEIYFSKKSLEVKYVNQLSIKFKSKSKYSRYGLKEDEIVEIFNRIYDKIKNWHNDWTIFDEDLQKAIDNLVDKKLRIIRSDTNQKFEELYPTKKSIKDVLNKSILLENDYKKLTDKIYKDIYDLKLRKNDICDELIIKYYNIYN